MRVPDFEEMLGRQSRWSYPSDGFRTWLRSRGVSEDEADLCDYAMPSEIAYLCGFWFNPESDVIAVNSNAAGGVPQALDERLLIIGTAPGGDPVAMDVRDEAGVVGLVNHERLWDGVPVRSIFAPIAESLDDLPRRYFELELPSDYDETLRKPLRR